MTLPKPRFPGLREALFVVFVAALPRLLGLGTFLTIDEPTWLQRSRVFGKAIVEMRWGDTDLTRHPGVTLMWLGTVSMAPKFLWEYFRASGPDGESLDDFAERFGPRDFASETQAAVAFSCLCALFVSVFLLARLTRPSHALWTGLFFAIEPLLVGYGKVFHLDMLMTSLMMLSFLCLLLYWKEERLLWCGLAGLFGGLAVLTKIPAVLSMLFMPCLALGKTLKRRELWPPMKGLLLCTLVCIGVVVFLWPAMLFHPIHTCARLLTGVGYGLTTVHGTGSFFLGQRIQSVGPAYMWVGLCSVLSPTSLVIGLVGLGMCVFSLRKRTDLWRADAGWGLAFLLMGFFYALMMNVGAKRAVRYGLILIVAVDLLAGFAAARLMVLLEGTDLRTRRAALGTLLVGVGLVGMWQVVRWHPYQISYVTSFVADRELDRDVLPRGWGEGLDLAAGYLNEKADPQSLVVSTWYDGSFAPFFAGETRNLGYASEGDTDYVILYANQIQRGYHQEVIDQYWGELPEYVASVNGRGMAWVYKAHPG